MAAALLLSEVSCFAGHTRRPRNLIVVTLDTMRADRLPIYGFSGIKTPTLERFSAGGAVFEQAFAAAPLTLPSHASLFTGLLPPRTGVRDNASPPLAETFTTLAEVMRGHGLATAAFVASSVLASSAALRRASIRIARPRRTALEYLRGGARRKSSTMPSHGSDRRIAHLFCLDPFVRHAPALRPAGRFREPPFDPYLSAVLYEDAQLGRVLSHLDARDLLQDTLVVVAGDHGESLGDHGEESHGIFLYEEALRVPLIIHGPGVPARRLMPVVRLIDVMPTVLDLFGIQAARMDGVSLTDLEPASAGREVYAETMYPLRFGWSPLRSLRADRFKLIDGPRPELFDLATDPMEQRNVVGDHPQVAEAMRRRVRAIDAGPAMPAPAPTDVDRSVMERMRSLGYVSGAPGEPRSAIVGLPDPKDRIDTFNKLTVLQRQNTEMRRSSCR